MKQWYREPKYHKKSS